MSGFRNRAWASVVLACTACSGSSHKHEDLDAMPDDASTDDASSDADVDAGPNGCDMTGRWVAEEHTVSFAFGSNHATTRYYLFDISQTGPDFVVTQALHCGFDTSGAATGNFPDATLTSLASTEMAGQGRGGRFARSGDECAFELDRMYSVRGASHATYLTWAVGDPDKSLADFPALPTTPPGMQDWDSDAMDGITVHTSLGDRYVVQRDYYEHAGTAPLFATEFGGEGIVVVTWDLEEGVSTQTAPILRPTPDPVGNGWARFVRAPNLENGTTVLETCDDVQAFAHATWP